MNDQREWVPFVVDESTESYSFMLPWKFTVSDDEKEVNNSNWTTVKQLEQWFDALHPSNYKEEAVHNGATTAAAAWTDAFYKGSKFLRKTAWVTLQAGCECDYGYSDTWQQRMSSSFKMHKVVEEMTQVIQHLIPRCPTLNSCNLNFYPRGGGVGFHADDEFLFDGLNRPTFIVSLSLCRGCKQGEGA